LHNIKKTTHLMLPVHEMVPGLEVAQLTPQLLAAVAAARDVPRGGRAAPRADHDDEEAAALERDDVLAVGARHVLPRPARPPQAVEGLVVEVRPLGPRTEAPAEQELPGLPSRSGVAPPPGQRFAAPRRVVLPEAVAAAPEHHLHVEVPPPLALAHDRREDRRPLPVRLEPRRHRRPRGVVARVVRGHHGLFARRPVDHPAPRPQVRPPGVLLALPVHLLRGTAS